ncbi:MAG: VWA domain-containing protein [Polyangiaceae bacterium]|nr:VWA domain-containing protein [Polyangiaceae bacterium]
MRWAEPLWLLGCLGALVIAALLFAGAALRARAARRFGDPGRVHALSTSDPAPRRLVSGVLTVLGVAAAFVAAAQPQYGRGTRFVPATDLDVAIVLDFSKSMYARDVAPSRIARAKVEVARLVQELPGTRFGAVAFAGEPLSFPLTSDGLAIAQFLRQLDPDDLPVGGTAIARALEAARELFARDPSAGRHRRVVLLVTDGEDLEGDPVKVAEGFGAEGTAVWVVQIGGRTPEPLPQLDEQGRVIGMRRDDQGRPMTTALTAAGEAQLTQIAERSGGRVLRPAKGEAGLADAARELRALVASELSERVETVYGDVFAWPLGLAIAALVAECFVGEARRRRRPPPPPPPERSSAGTGRRGAAGAAAARLAVGAAVALGLASGCDVDRWFRRDSPAVRRAIVELDAGDASAAAGTLGVYLSVGACDAGTLGLSEQVRERPYAGLDLGLALFEIGERFGERFGADAPDAAPSVPSQEHVKERSAWVDCALSIVRAVALERAHPAELRARAQYLAGNLEFLRGDYASAVREYDAALELVPGAEDAAADPVGADAAWNRAVALRRLAEQHPDAGSDARPEAGPDGGGDDGGDSGSGDSGGGDSGDGGAGQPDGSDADGGGGGGQDAGGGDRDAGGGGSDAGRPPPQAEDGGAAPQPPPASQDDRVLDRLERAPMLLHEGLRGRSRRRVVLEDK